MRTSTYLITFLALLLFFASPAKAQIDFPDLETSPCEFEDPNGCFFVAYEAIKEESPTSPTLVIALNAILTGTGTCDDIDGFLFTAPDLTIVQRTREDLDENSIVEITVSREAFMNNPTMIVATYENITIDIPIIGEITIPLPTEVVNLRAEDPDNTDDLCTPIVPLPVELISFEGRPTAAGIALEWSTASEKDNSHFEVERSTDGQAFNHIGEVAGNGNSSVKLEYRYLDPTPNNDLNYYRLKQVDLDGKYEYSKVIAVTADVLANSELSINLAPNPCLNGDCAAIITSPVTAGTVDLQLKDLSGRVVFTKIINREGSGTLKLPMQELAPYKGLFILTATSGNSVVHKRVVLR